MMRTLDAMSAWQAALEAALAACTSLYQTIVKPISRLSMARFSVQTDLLVNSSSLFVTGSS